MERRKAVLGFGAGLWLALSSPAFPIPGAEPRRDVRLEAMEQFLVDDDAGNRDVLFSVKQGVPDVDGSFFGAAGGDSLADAARWQIQILNAGGEKVGFVQGRGRPPSSIKWNGLSPSGRAVPDGFYEARFVWADGRGRPHRSPSVTIGFLASPVIEEIRSRRILVEYRQEGLVLRIAEIEAFLPGRSDILPKAVPALRDIARFLKEYSRNRVAIRGFTDSIGSSALNRVLSVRRAFSIFSYLADNGVSLDRLSYEGKGASQPVASNATAEGRAQNRRVEIVVLKRST